MDLEDLVDDELVVPLVDAVISEDMVATEQLIQSIKTETTKTSDIDEVRVYAESYLLELRDGEQYKSPPTLEDISTWILAKDLEGILDPYAVLENINQFGTSWDQKGGSTKLQEVLSESNIKRIMNIAIDETINEISNTKWLLR